MRVYIVKGKTPSNSKTWIEGVFLSEDSAKKHVKEQNPKAKDVKTSEFEILSFRVQL